MSEESDDIVSELSPVPIRKPFIRVRTIQKVIQISKILKFNLIDPIHLNKSKEDINKQNAE